MSSERPDHPHHAAVHLMRALKCCEECAEGDDQQILQVRQLEYRKEVLADELRRREDRGRDNHGLKDEILHLEGMVRDLGLENQQSYQLTLQSIDKHKVERERHQHQQHADLDSQLIIEINLTKSLTLQFEGLMEKVRSLNRINNQLIYNFCAI